MGRISPDYYVQDGVVPRTRLPETLRRIGELSRTHGLEVGNVFHAGDGNLHPLVLYDGAVEGQAERAEELASAILQACVDAGGSLTGEHGIGLDKACHMPLMYSPDDMATMLRLRTAFDPGWPVQSGQGVSDPAPVRRGARALPPASRRARGGRAMVIEHEPGDLTCTVAADVPLAELQRVVARGGQMLALDPPGGDALTVGEAFATAGFGPRAHRYGPAARSGARDDRAAGRRHGRAGRRPGRQDGGRLRPAQALHRRARPAGRDPRADAAPASAARRDLHRRHHARPIRWCSSRSRRPASSTPGRPSACWCGSRARSHARWPSRPRSWSGGELHEDDDGLWAEHRELAAGLPLTRCLPADVPGTIAQLRAAGATTIVGRYARGLLHADVNIECLAPDIHRVALERRVVEAYGG